MGCDREGPEIVDIRLERKSSVNLSSDSWGPTDHPGFGQTRLT